MFDFLRKLKESKAQSKELTDRDRRGQEVYEHVLTWMVVRPMDVCEALKKVAIAQINKADWADYGPSDQKAHVLVQIKVFLERVPEFYDQMIEEAYDTLNEDIQIAKEIGSYDFIDYTIRSRLREIASDLLNSVTAEAYRVLETPVPPPTKFFRSEWPGGENDPDRFLAAMESR